MLDQNTDRMWYVIGAVLVGAAIILIANGTIPEIFANVTSSFDEVSNNAISGISEISGDNLGSYLNNIDNWERGGAIFKR